MMPVCINAALTTQWSRMLPSLSPVIMTATIMHMCPILREVTQWAGGRAVSRPGILAALQDEGAVILVPGGQSEMLESGSHREDIVVHTRHLGFIRAAVQVGADLVPVLSLGGTRLLDNFFNHFPLSWQRRLLKATRVNALFLPTGFCGLPFCPRPKRVAIVVGTPIRTDVVAAGVQHGSEEHISALHHAYYSELRRIFARNVQRSGHPADKLVLKPPLPPMTAVQQQTATMSVDRAVPVRAAPPLRLETLGPKWHTQARSLGEFFIVAVFVLPMLALGFLGSGRVDWAGFAPRSGLAGGE